MFTQNVSRKHGNIVKYEDCWLEKETDEDDNDEKLCILLEYCEDGSLRDILYSNKVKRSNTGLISEAQIVAWFLQICRALKHLHDRHIIHRNIKVTEITCI